jgi:hypothetical protein
MYLSTIGVAHDTLAQPVLHVEISTDGLTARQLMKRCESLLDKLTRVEPSKLNNETDKGKKLMVVICIVFEKLMCCLVALIMSGKDNLINAESLLADVKNQVERLAWPDLVNDYYFSEKQHYIPLMSLIAK